MTVIHSQSIPTSQDQKEYVRGVSDKGQVTIPAEIRRELGVKAHGEVVFRIKGQKVELMPATGMSLEEIAGSVPPLKSGKSIEEAIQEAKEGCV